MDLDKASQLLNFYNLKYPKELEFLPIAHISGCENLHESLTVLHTLVTENILEEVAKDHYKMTEHGKKILAEYGNYKNYKSTRQKEKEESTIKEKLALKKLKNDALLSSWKKYTYWPLFGLAIIGGTSGIISLVKQIKFEKQSKPQKEIIQPIQKIDSTKTTKQAVLKPVKSSNEKEEEKTVLDKNN